MRTEPMLWAFIFPFIPILPFHALCQTLNVMSIFLYIFRHLLPNKPPGQDGIVSQV